MSGNEFSVIIAVLGLDLGWLAVHLELGVVNLSINLYLF